MSNCISCHEVLIGNYCHNCGEKTVQSTDFSIRKLSRDAFSSLFNFDSKFYKSIGKLITKPGFLTTEYIRGHRKPYMKPFQLFFISTILFYVFFSSVDVFLIPSQWYFNSDAEGMENIRLLADSIANKWNLTNKEFSILYDSRVGANSKLFIFLLIPVIAFASLIVGYSQYKQYGIHIVHAVHLITFILLCFICLYFIMAIIPKHYNGIYIIVPITIILSTYFTFSIRRVFNFRWKRSIISSSILTFFVIATCVAFRNGISYLTLKSLYYPFFMDGF